MYARLLLPLLILLVTPSFAHAAPPKTFGQLVTELISILDAATLTLIILGLVIYFWGISVNVIKFENDPEKMKAYFVWGIIVLFVMVSIWGIISILGNTLFGKGYFVTQRGGIEVPVGEPETPWTTIGIGGGI